MKLRTRKFIGVFGGTAYLILYSMIAMALGGALVVGAHGGLQFVFFVVAGIMWLPGMMAIIRWMSKPDD